MMIDRLLYAATALTLASVLMFDDTFSANLVRAIGPIAVPSLNPWEMAVAGILAALIVTVLYPMKVRIFMSYGHRHYWVRAQARREHPS